MIQAVLFDCDGVIVDSEPALARIAAEVLRGFGLEACPSDFQPYIGTGEDTYIAEVVKQYGGTYTPEIKQAVYQAYIERCADYLEEVSGACQLVQQLRQAGYRLALASSADRIKVEANLRAVGLSEADFDAVLTGSDVTKKKPFPEIYLKSAEAVGVLPEYCLVVEDAVAGVQAGLAAEMSVLGISSSLNAEVLAEAGAREVLSDLREAFSWIQKH